MSEEVGSTEVGGTEAAQPWTTTSSAAAAEPLYAAPAPPLAATGGLSDGLAGALAYVTLLPPIVFLLIEPYKSRAFVKFHSFQALGLVAASIVLYIAVIVISLVFAFLPFLHWVGFVLFPVYGLTLFVVWVLCVLKAFQGGVFTLPYISDFAAKQSGYVL